MEKVAIAFSAAIILPVLVFGYIKMKRHADKMRHEMWREVPPPNWRCRRGGRDYL